MAGSSPLTVAALAASDLTATRLAFLSACETGVLGASVPDELISLGAVLHAARVAVVVSSLWRVADTATLVLVALFYAELADQAAGEPEDATAALALAQRRMRASSDGEPLQHLRDLRAVGRVPDAVVEAVETWVGRLPPGSRELSEPDAWAAFTVSGVYSCPDRGDQPATLLGRNRLKGDLWPDLHSGSGVFAPSQLAS